ncbi:hypothetical protein Ddye_026193 [Dipteronia dyeriana]|uniref:RNase H type-1 domain-containing protein n=1 Tax=Dipteronia dyeriana TaxID=168575 RepID=A0AAD9TM94_9ROSI|nr:hypothetical protein Ddye_026193 [Dipteronia dyeriana]
MNLFQLPKSPVNKFIDSVPGSGGEAAKISKKFTGASGLGCVMRKGKLNNQRKIWKPPNLGLHKINCDAIIDLADCLVGSGAVIRNEEGLVMAASSQRMMATFPPHIAEATAILHGIQLAIDSGLYPIMVESETAVVVDWINGGDTLYSEIGVIISDIKNLLQLTQCTAVAFIPRSANQVAHCLAKYDLSCNEDMVGGLPPLC